MSLSATTIGPIAIAAVVLQSSAWTSRNGAVNLGVAGVAVRCIGGSNWLAASV
jgi:hypothetical protein